MLSSHIDIKKLGATALILFLWGCAYEAQAQFEGDTQGCPADRPCITSLHTSGSTLSIGWTGNGNYGHYNLRWSRPGKAVTQHEVQGGPGGSFSINNVNLNNVRYTVAVQGCDRSFLSSSKCTPWFEDSIVTGLHHGVFTCKPGFVWREARSSDKVCVLPKTRDQTALDNQLAASRRSPNGGSFGLATCKQGFVWREAFAGDRVCVLPKTRDEAARDNQLAPLRRVL